MTTCLFLGILVSHLGVGVEAGSETEFSIVPCIVSLQFPHSLHAPTGLDHTRGEFKIVIVNIFKTNTFFQRRAISVQ